MATVAVQTHQPFQTPDHHQHLQHESQSTPAPGSGTGVPVWQNPNPPLPRGRAPRDPLAVTSRFQCNTLVDMETRLREYLTNLPAPPEHCTCELTLWAGASFLVKLDFVPKNLQASQEQRDNGAQQPVVDPSITQRPGSDPHESTLSVLDALQQLNDPKETMRRQRAISKVLVAAIQKTDGFRYSFHNSWKSGEDNAYRFSYYCNDSLLNKDRVANGKSGSQGKRATKPVYDCKGVLSIKFSATRQCIDVVYRHVPCHETYEDRAPPPRKTAKRRAEWEQKFPDRIKTNKEATPKSSSEAPVVEPSAKRKKKKADSKTQQSTESELREQSMFSLLELMRPGEDDKVDEAVIASSISPAIPIPSAPPVPVQKTSARKKPNPIVCAICVSRRTKCDGVKPKCKSCGEKGWPCFYLPDPPQNAKSQVGAGQPPGTPLIATQASLPSFETMHQNELAALTLSNQNEDLQKELASVRQDQLNTQKETYDLKSKLAEMQKQLEALQAENLRLNSPQTGVNHVNVDHNRRATQHHHVPSTPAQPTYAPQYQSNPQHIYHQSAPSQAAHSRAPVVSHQQSVYQQANERAPTAWGPQPLNNAYPQPNQHPYGMLPQTHMPGGWGR